MDIIGILGLVCILAGWIPELKDTIKNNKNNLNIKFSVLYMSGSFLLMIHSLELGDIIFTILNGIAMIMGFISLIYTIKNNKK
jgi:lipid-A-disaccharide synthase-like uncharacterized protein